MKWSWWRNDISYNFLAEWFLSEENVQKWWNSFQLIEVRFPTVSRFEGSEKNDFGNEGWKLPEKKDERLENVDDWLGDDDCDDNDCLGSLMGLCSVP